MTTPFVIKEDPDCPDYYEVDILFLGSQKPIKKQWVSHQYIFKTPNRVMPPDSDHLDEWVIPGEIMNCPYIEYRTTEDKIGSIPLSSIADIEYDKRFTRICENVQNKSTPVPQT